MKKFICLLLVSTVLYPGGQRGARSSLLSTDTPEEIQHHSGQNPRAQSFQLRTQVASGDILGKDKILQIARGMNCLEGFKNKQGEKVVTNQRDVQAIFDVVGLSYLSIASAQIDSSCMRFETNVGRLIDLESVTYAVKNPVSSQPGLIELRRIRIN